jgi:polar amino acid transport system substrate-binding protein
MLNIVRDSRLKCKHKRKYEEYIMLPYQTFLMLILCVFGLLSPVLAETKLIIATGELPPYTSTNPKESFLTEVLDEVAREMGVTFEFRFMPWKRCEFSVEKLKAWGTVPYVRTTERENKFYFSDTLFTRPAKFFYYMPDGTRKQIPFSKLSDLKAFKIGAVRGYYYTQSLIGAGLNVVFVTTDEQAFRMLKDKRVELVPADDAVGNYLIRKLWPDETANFFTLTKPLDISSESLMTSKNYPDTQNLLNKFNVALKKIKENGVYQRILNKYKVVVTF